MEAKGVEGEVALYEEVEEVTMHIIPACSIPNKLFT